MNIVSVIAPCRNERAHVEVFCNTALAQQLPPDWSMEVLVADGMSDDGTREQLALGAERDARLRWIDNPGRIVSTGLNAALVHARGCVVARFDIHTEFAPNYIAECLAALERSGADAVGGPWVARGDAPMQRAIATAFQSRWVVGGARSRDTTYEGEVDTVYLGCWPRATFDRFGGFDEALVRNQDDEYNLRVRKGGGRIWQSGRIRSTYSPRGSLTALFNQQQQYGYWRPFVIRKHRQPGSWRQLVPALFVATLLGGALLLPWTMGPLFALLALYAVYVGAASLNASGGEPASLWRLPAVIAAYHIGYGIGTWRGLWDVWRGRAPGQGFSHLTR